MTVPRVSVVINFLNREAFLAEAIESVLGQTFDDWELLLVDDGSTDASSSIARRYSTEHPAKVRYLEHDRHQNLGTSASRNLGLQHARGEFLAYLDSDDVWVPKKLEEQVALLDQNPDVGLVYGRTYLWADWTGRPRDRFRNVLHPNAVPPGTVLRPPQMLLLYLRNQRAVATGILYRTSLLRDVGGWEDRFRGMYDDQVLYAKIGLRASALVSGRCWYKYRVHEDQMVQQSLRVRDGLALRERYLQWLEAYLDHSGLRGTEAWMGLEEALRPFNHPVWRRIESLRYLAGVLRRRAREARRRWLPLPVLGLLERPPARFVDEPCG